MKQEKLLKTVLGEEVYESLNKALQKLNTRSVVDIQELHAAMQTVPKAVMAFLIKELKPMEKGGAKEIKLPYHENSILLINKHDNDVYAGNIAQDGKVIHEFALCSLPQLAAHLVSTYELYDDKQEEEANEISNTESTSNKEEYSEKIEQLNQDLINEKIKVLESKIDKIMIMISQQKPEEEIKKSENKALNLKLKSILSNKNLKKAGLAPTMPKPPRPGVHSGSQRGIAQTGFHGDKTASTDLNPKKTHTGVKNPFLKKPKAQPGTASQPKQPKTQLTLKSESNSTCCDCGQKLIKSNVYIGCACFKVLSKPELKKNENGSTTFTFNNDWDEDAKIALWLTLKKK